MDEYLSCELVGGKIKQKSNRKDKGGPNRKGRKSRWEEGKGKEERPKLKGKKIKWGRREREGGKDIKNKREREKMGREEKRRDYSTEKIAKLRRKGREK